MDFLDAELENDIKVEVSVFSRPEQYPQMKCWNHTFHKYLLSSVSGLGALLGTVCTNLDAFSLEKILGPGLTCPKGHMKRNKYFKLGVFVSVSFHR